MSKLRQDADAIIQAAITAAQPDEAVRKALEGRDFGSGRVVLVAAGKGAWQMASAASRILGSRIDTGIVITKYDHSKGPIANFTIQEAGHPIPDENSFTATQQALDHGKRLLELLKQLQHKYNLTIIYITHDLGVVANVADRVAVMYAGDIVEIGTCEEVFETPKHPYTWALLSSLPQLGIKGEPLYSIEGTPPNLFTEIRGDAFAPRNRYAMQIDLLERPPYFEVSPTHKARTWLLDPRSPKVEPPEHIKNIRNIRANMDQKEGGAQ